MATPRPLADQKAAVINHMNKDHQESISLYLRYYAKLALREAKTGVLEDLELGGLWIRTSTDRYMIELNPPMASFAQARNRLVDMDREATEGLGLSKIVVNTFSFPLTSRNIATFLTASFGWIVNSSPNNFRVGSFFANHFLRSNVAVCNFLEKAQPYILAFMVVVHSAEMAYFARSRLDKHRVPSFGAVWMAWLISGFIEGIGSFWRFDELVAAKKAEMEKKASKH
ncbi:MAG: hypothetical protein M1814_006923 [Vezdaea aestivalis]|nr:MAG: hypothetical protein M1814_006923 [Vezdaea aestivalis]